MFTCIIKFAVSNFFELIKNTNPLWTEKHLENIQLFSESYGLNFKDEDIYRQRMKIRDGNSDRRTLESMICYEIYSDNVYIGDLNVALNYEIPEIDVIIFNEYGGNGYASKAIKRFIDFEGRKFNEIECTVRHKNPNLSKVKYIIEGLGFKYIYSSPDVEVYRFTRS